MKQYIAKTNRNKAILLQLLHSFFSKLLVDASSLIADPTNTTNEHETPPSPPDSDDATGNNTSSICGTI